MITALFTLVLAFQASSPYVSRIPIDPDNPPAVNLPNCKYREDPPRPMPDNYLDLTALTTPDSDQAFDPVSGQNVDVYLLNPITWRSTLPFPWTQLVIECQATDDQWAQITAGLQNGTGPIVISSEDIDCPLDGSGMYFNWLRGTFQCVGSGPIFEPQPGYFPPFDPANTPWVDPPDNVCYFMPGSDHGRAWMINYPGYNGADFDGNVTPIPCDASSGYALFQPEPLSAVFTLKPFNMGEIDTATCLTDDGSDWFYNTALNTLKQCARMLADDADVVVDPQ